MLSNNALRVKEPDRFKKVFDAMQVANLIENILVLVVDSSLKVLLHDDQGVIRFTVLVDEKDYGKVLGREGKMAQALRTILSAIAGNFDRRLAVEFQIKQRA